MLFLIKSYPFEAFSVPLFDLSAILEVSEANKYFTKHEEQHTISVILFFSSNISSNNKSVVWILVLVEKHFGKVIHHIN